jgi:alpha-galactosidase
VGLAEVYPDGLAPLIDHVTGLGMEFGIWVEPEMVNPDSELYRSHPDWVLATDGYEPVLGRNQLVLDLARREAFAHVLGQLDALLADHDISYVKWDMNRDHVQGAGATGSAGTRAQTLAVYALLDELRSRHPAVEFESCASGGGRIDLEILRRAERVWTSDCNDALERQTIQRGASMLIPPEVMGAHIGPRRAHTTGRRHTLAFRAATALFGHLGVEWNVMRLDTDERAELAAAIACTSASGRCCTGAMSSASTSTRRTWRTACTPPTAPRPSCRSSSWHPLRASPRRRCACRASTRNVGTGSSTSHSPANDGGWPRPSPGGWRAASS